MPWDAVLHSCTMPREHKAAFIKNIVLAGAALYETAIRHSFCPDSTRRGGGFMQVLAAVPVTMPYNPKTETRGLPEIAAVKTKLPSTRVSCLGLRA